MNKIELVPSSYKGQNYLAIYIDGQALNEYFVSRKGLHPTELSVFGGLDHSECVNRFLCKSLPELESGRNAVLACELCRDINCGAITVRVSKQRDCYRWSDWRYEDGLEVDRELYWQQSPEEFVFDKSQYEAALKGWSNA